MRAIDADALIPMMKYATTDSEIGVFPIKIGFNDIKKVINEQPTIEPQRKKGMWIPVSRIEKWHKEEGLVGFPPEVKEFPQCTIEWVDATESDAVDGLRCSECGTVYDFTEARNWCSECGAKMEGQDDRK